MSRLAVIGMGYVGLTSAACFAHLGHTVHGADVDRARIGLLRKGVVPIVEDGLDLLVREGLDTGRLRFEERSDEAVRDAEFVFLCVPTPQSDDGHADMSYIEAAVREIGPHLRPGAVIVNKSTVPVGSVHVVERVARRADIAVVSNPEFLREGSAVRDCLEPDRIVIGAEEEEVAARVASLFLKTGAPVIVTDPASAETIKYASNAFLATKLSFVNAVAALCEAVGADITAVTRAMGLDARIGADFLRPGPGWGGSCLPKDTVALVRIAEDAGYDFKLLKGTIEANEEQRERVVRKLEHLVGGSLEGRVVAQWGLTFKAGTDDLRASPALDIARRVAERGATVRAFDPAVSQLASDPALVSDPVDACKGADALLVATEWPGFRRQDFARLAGVMAHAAVLDARNALDREALHRAGFRYEGIGIS